LVEFCPKCGSLLVPKKEHNKVILFCSRCGYSKKVKEISGYKSIEKIPEKKKSRIAVVEKKSIDKKKVEEEQELLKEYYEVLLTTMEQEETGET